MGRAIFCSTDASWSSKLAADVVSGNPTGNICLEEATFHLVSERQSAICLQAEGRQFYMERTLHYMPRLVLIVAIVQKEKDSLHLASPSKTRMCSAGSTR